MRLQQFLCENLRKHYSKTSKAKWFEVPHREFTEGLIKYIIFESESDFSISNIFLYCRVFTIASKRRRCKWLNRIYFTKVNLYDISLNYHSSLTMSFYISWSWSIWTELDNAWLLCKIHSRVIVLYLVRFVYFQMLT